MNSKLYTFIELFNSSYGDNIEQNISKVMIPVIQRDYAQGRKSFTIDRVRSNFLNSLYEAFKGNPIVLDFIYGKIDKEGVLTPLDGQQRLTTLFLLHWYAAQKDKIASDEYEFLKKFSYETRFSARSFCEHLIGFKPDLNNLSNMKLSEQIIDATWFPLDWQSDPTINSMLVMLDAIADKFSNVENMWAMLKNNAISFYFLALDDIGMTDELYIKMNSRGKPLNQFEHFKAELEHEIRKYDEALAERITRKIDCDWTDMLWADRGNNNITDDEFLRYFHFICDIICYKENDSPADKGDDEFILLDDYFSSDNPDRAKKNIELLEAYFDVWCGFNKYERTQFFSKFIGYKHMPGKIVLPATQKKDLFEDCICSYADVFNDSHREFSLSKIILLFTFVTYLLNKEKVSEEQFCRRLRIVNNLIQNSNYEIREKASGSEVNHMPGILEQVEHIILNGQVNKNIANSFNAYQLMEEYDKVLWVEAHQNLAESLFKLEDHKLLTGQIAILGLSNPEYFERFTALFECDWDNVDCALMAKGFYPQQEKNNWRYQFGSSALGSAWRELFHRSANKGFENTSKILQSLLNTDKAINDVYLVDVIDEFLKQSESKNVYEWRYYYVKYPDFRPGSYGKFFAVDYKGEGYVFLAMTTAKRPAANTTYQPFMRVINESSVENGNYRQYLKQGNIRAFMNDDSFVIYDVATEKQLGVIKIAKYTDGVDSENRILKFKEMIKKYL